MDEALEAIEVAEQFGLDGIISWVLRAVGLLLVLAGLGMWLLTDAGLLVLPAGLLVVGVVLLVATKLLFAVAELA